MLLKNYEEEIYGNVERIEIIEMIAACLKDIISKKVSDCELVIELHDTMIDILYNSNFTKLFSSIYNMKEGEVRELIIKVFVNVCKGIKEAKMRVDEICDCNMSDDEKRSGLYNTMIDILYENKHTRLDI